VSFSERIRGWLESIDGDVIIPVEAAKLVAQAREQYPGELAAWLDENAAAFVGERMARATRSERSIAQRRHSPRAFAEAAGDTEAVVAFLDVRYVVDDMFTRRRLRDMTHADLIFVIADYDAQSAKNANEAAFLRAVAKRVPKQKKVGDVLTDEQLRALRQAAA
jgi:hypothetical protein